MKVVFCLIAALVVQCVSANQGFDLYSAVNDFSCLKQKGITYIITRAYHSYGAVDTNAVINLKNARALGLQTDVYMFPCNGIDPAVQVQQLVQGVPSSMYDRVWIDVEDNPKSSCDWSTSPSTNCDFLTKLVQELQKANLKVGIYCSQHFWTKFFGTVDYCAKFTDLGLWYAHYDNNPSFSDWPKFSFGKWSAPTIKQYSGGGVICGVDVDLDYKP